MSDCAKCTNCGSDDVEATGAIRYELDEYYCHDCEKYFSIDWDKQDEIEESNIELQDDYEDDDEEGEDDWENEGGQ